MDEQEVNGHGEAESLDKESVPVMATTVQYVSFPKPEGFDKRELCGAVVGDKPPCTNPAKTCRRHCGAWGRRKGAACGATPMMGRKRCDKHGGKTLQGQYAPNYRNGRYSQCLPEKMLERYECALADDQLMSTRSEIALLTGRIEEMLERLKSGESSSIWEDLKKAHSDLMEAVNSGDQNGIRASLKLLEWTIKNGASEQEIWNEVREILKERSQHIQIESKRMVEASQMVTVEESMTLITSIMRSVKSHVKDNDALKSIAQDMDALLLEDKRTVKF